jgi:UDPglucose 6-dehydrogenase
MSTGHVGLISTVGLAEFLGRNLDSGRPSFSSDVRQAVEQAEAVFNTVGTPPQPDGNIDLSQIYAVVALVGKRLKSYKVIVNKSTIPVGTNRAVGE